MEPAAGGQKLEMTVNRWLHQGKEDGDTVREIAVTWPGEEPHTGWYNIRAAEFYQFTLSVTPCVCHTTALS